MTPEQVDRINSLKALDGDYPPTLEQVADLLWPRDGKPVCVKAEGATFRYMPHLDGWVKVAA